MVDLKKKKQEKKHTMPVKVWELFLFHIKTSTKLLFLTES